LDRPNFKACQHFDTRSGICKAAKNSPEAAAILKSIGDGVSMQCCFLMPSAVAYECPNPLINPKPIIAEDEDSDEEATSLDKIYNLRDAVNSADVLDSIIRLLAEFRQDIEVLKESVRQDTNNSLKSLENRVKTVERILNAERKPGITFPNGEVHRKTPVQRKSKESEKDLEYTNPDKAQKDLDLEINSLDLSEEVFQKGFFEEMGFDEKDLEDLEKLQEELEELEDE
jgi:hypothetical protein